MLSGLLLVLMPSRNSPQATARPCICGLTRTAKTANRRSRETATVQTLTQQRAWRKNVRFEVVPANIFVVSTSAPCLTPLAHSVPSIPRPDYVSDGVTRRCVHNARIGGQAFRIFLTQSSMSDLSQRNVAMNICVSHLSLLSFKNKIPRTQKVFRDIHFKTIL